MNYHVALRGSPLAMVVCDVERVEMADDFVILCGTDDEVKAAVHKDTLAYIQQDDSQE